MLWLELFLHTACSNAHRSGDLLQNGSHRCKSKIALPCDLGRAFAQYRPPASRANLSPFTPTSQAPEMGLIPHTCSDTLCRPNDSEGPAYQSAAVQASTSCGAIRSSNKPVATSTKISPFVDIKPCCDFRPQQSIPTSLIRLAHQSRSLHRTGEHSAEPLRDST